MLPATASRQPRRSRLPPSSFALHPGRVEGHETRVGRGWPSLLPLLGQAPLTVRELTGPLRETVQNEVEMRRRGERGRTLSERSGTLADDPFGGRQPTSHERMTGQPWDASYHDGPAPWDVGHPQPAIVRLASEGGFAGAVLDAGCGTGENALHLASLGLSVLGVDVAETALTIARAKADDRGLEVEFAAADAFHLERLGRSVRDGAGLRTVPRLRRRRTTCVRRESGVGDRARRNAVCVVLQRRGSRHRPAPRQSGRAESGVQRRARGWNVAAIDPDRVQTRFHDDDGAPAWLATIKRIEATP